MCSVVTFRCSGAIYYHMDVDSILHIDCKHENLGANDNDLIKTDSK
jgi:hypothetical protein